MTDQDRLRAALADPTIYPGHPDRVEVRETHISVVFLAGDRAYKLKKAVTLPFVDYRSVDRRRVMCGEEVRLNRRLAPRVYLGVRAVVERDDGVALAGPYAPGALDYLVEMRRVAEDMTLAALLQRDAATAVDLRAIGFRLARFHVAASVDPEAGDATSRLRGSFGETVATLRSQRPDMSIDLAAAERFFDAYLTNRGALLADRAAHGCVCDGHGDLRAEHVLLEHGVEVLDCVEFDAALRNIDVAEDIAFLVMDLHRLGRPDASQDVLAAYREAGGDPGDDSLLAFHASNRAWIRAKVAATGAVGLGAQRNGARDEAADEVGAYARLAKRFRWRARQPLLLVVCGVAGVGKSHLARRLSKASGLRVLSSDELRKRISGLPRRARGTADLYTEEMNLRTYAELGRCASAEVHETGGAIIDATFRKAAHRQAFEQSLSKTPAPVFVECAAPEEVVRERAERRERDPERISDAGAAVAIRQITQWEPLTEVPRARRIVVRTDAASAATVDEIEAFLDRCTAAGASDG